MPRAERRLVLKGRGIWKEKNPLVFFLIGGPRPYLWIGQLDDAGDEHYITSISPAQTRQLAKFMAGIADA